MVKDDLKRSFALDVVLLQPRVAAGGGSRRRARDHQDLDRLARRVNSSTASGDRCRRDGVVEMVLTGKVNTEIVGLINTLGGTAMGLSARTRTSSRRTSCRPAGQADLGWVGEVESIKTEVLDMLLDKHYMP